MQISNSNINYINGDGDDHLKSIQPIRSYLLLLIMLVNILRSVPYSHKETNTHFELAAWNRKVYVYLHFYPPNQHKIPIQ